MGWGTADQAGVGDAGETDPGDVPGAGVDPLEIPDGLGRLGVVIREEAPAILLGEDAGESPFVSLEGPDIENIHHQNVARLSSVHPDRPTQDMDDFKIHIGDILRIIVVLDLAIGPVFAFDPEHIPGID